MWVLTLVDSSILATSAASIRRAIALGPAQIDAGCHLEAFRQLLEEPLVHVGAAELGIAAGGLDLEHPLAELHDGHVERAAAQIDHHDAQFLPQPVEAVGQGRGGGFVDQTHHFEAGDRAASLVAVRWLSSK